MIAWVDALGEGSAFGQRTPAYPGPGSAEGRMDLANGAPALRGRGQVKGEQVSRAALGDSSAALARRG